ITPARAGPSAKGSIMRCWCAMRRIQRSDLMDMVAQYIGAIDTYATRSVDKGPTAAVGFGGLSEFFHERDDPTLRVLPAAAAARGRERGRHDRRLAPDHAATAHTREGASLRERHAAARERARPVLREVLSRRDAVHRLRHRDRVPVHLGDDLPGRGCTGDGDGVLAGGDAGVHADSRRGLRVRLETGGVGVGLNHMRDVWEKTQGENRRDDRRMDQTRTRRMPTSYDASIRRFRTVFLLTPFTIRG